jgi:hypothetical protein
MNAMTSIVRWLAAAAAALLAGCAGYSPGSLPQGASRDETVKVMGAPTGQYALPNGGTRLEFARGPFGKHTYMLDFDAGGRLLHWQQVLTEANFNALQMGMSREEVLMKLGRPSDTRYIQWQKLVLWSYRYDAVFCQWFNVGFNAQGRVADLGYTPDPLCDINDKDDWLS